ncbi:MAG: AMP-binding protein, partial [Woeseiaceae bacterium]|nr:AMP-binding protein [Woeseiaceae bacterium]
MQYDSLTHILSDARDRALEILFVDGSNDESTLTIDQLWQQAVALLGELQHRGMHTGDELIIYANSNRRFLIAFWAALLGGIVPVPIAVGSNDEHRAKLFRIMRQLKHATLYTDHEQRRRLEDYARPRDYADIMRQLRSHALVDEELTGGKSGEPVDRTEDAMAFIQYSSGSTSDPKGVCLTHANLTSNIAAIVEGTGWTATDRSLSWMPLTHDMGLIGFHLSVLAAGMHHAIMDTGVFVRRPLLWLLKAQEYGATQLCSPNFGYKHFLKVFRSKGLDNLDLSAVRLILNGAEPISWALCEEFLEAMAPYGLKKSTMLPVYGLAEATVAVSIPRPGRQYERIVVDRHDLKIGQPFTPLDDDADDAVSFVKVGRAVRDCEIRIVNDDDRVLDDAVVGNIQVRGKNVTRGIYGDPGAADALFADDRWLRTGDCGGIVDGELVITGRARELIIVNGQNYYPHDLEEMIARLDALDLGKVV